MHKVEDQRGMIHKLDGYAGEVLGHSGRSAGWAPASTRDARHAGACWRKPASNTSATGSMTTEPTVIKTANGPLVTLSYTVELNDIPMIDRAAPRRPVLASEMRRCLRPSLRRGRHLDPHHGHCHPPLHLRPAVPHQKYLERVYDYVNRHSGVLHWNGARDLRLV